MLRIRIITIGAAFAFAITGAAAQSATSGSAGKPLPLLQFVGHKAKPAVHAHARRPEKLAKRTSAKTRLARRKPAKPHRELAAARRHATPVASSPAPSPAPVQSANAGGPASVWPVADSGAPGAVIGNSNGFGPATAAPAAISNETVVESDPNEIVTGAQSGAPSGTKTVTPLKLTAAGEAAKPAAAPGAVAPPAVTRAMIVSSPARSSDPVGSAPWIAQVLAALGGAIAAGVVAWFLIKPTPERAA